jgi:hypothetical protein
MWSLDVSQPYEPPWLVTGISLPYHLFINDSTALCLALDASYTQSVGLVGCGTGPSQGPYVHTGQHKENKRTLASSMPREGLEPTISVFQRAKTVHILDCSATVIGLFHGDPVGKYENINQDITAPDEVRTRHL